jgi:hypothetical protein
MVLSSLIPSGEVGAGSELTFAQQVRLASGESKSCDIPPKLSVVAVGNTKRIRFFNSLASIVFP